MKPILSMTLVLALMGVDAGTGLILENKPEGAHPD